MPMAAPSGHPPRTPTVFAASVGGGEAKNREKSSADGELGDAELYADAVRGWFTG